jgi:hypothetical protein
MPATYEPIATSTLGSAAASITFSSIPATYTDLRLVFSGTSSSTGQAQMRFNSDATSLYSYLALFTNGTTAGGDTYNNANEAYITYYSLSTTLPGTAIVDIFAYAGSSSKSFLVQSSVYSAGLVKTVQMYRSNSAISSILIFSAGYNLNAGTTATIYGIKAA